MDRSRHTLTKYISEEKTQAAIESSLFKKLDHVNNSWYEIELAKAQPKHKESIIAGVFILQYAKLQMLELYYNFSTKFCVVYKFKELEMAQICCIFLLPGKSWKIVSDLKWEWNCRGCHEMTELIDSLLIR